MELCFLSGMTSSEVAAWVQAVGSIGAILSAVWISRRSADKALKEKRKSIRAIAEAAHDFSIKVRDVVVEKDDYQEAFRLLHGFYNISRIDSLVKAINGIPMHELGSSEAVTAMLSLGGQVALLGVAVEGFLTVRSVPPRYTLVHNEETGKPKLQADTLLARVAVRRGNVQKHFENIERDCSVLRDKLA